MSQKVLFNDQVSIPGNNGALMGVSLVSAARTTLRCTCIRRSDPYDVLAAGVWNALCAIVANAPAGERYKATSALRSRREAGLLPSRSLGVDQDLEVLLGTHEDLPEGDRARVLRRLLARDLKGLRVHLRWESRV